MGVNKKKISKKLSKIGQKVKRKSDTQSVHDDQEIILENIEINNGIEVTGEEQLTQEQEEVILCCTKCQGELSNALGTSSKNNRYRCNDCGTLYELVPKGKKTKKKKSKKKRVKKAGHRAWRACITGWKYVKAGLVFYVHTPANGFNITGMATAHMAQAQNSNDPMHKKYGYMYTT